MTPLFPSVEIAAAIFFNNAAILIIASLFQRLLKAGWAARLYPRPWVLAQGLVQAPVAFRQVGITGLPFCR